MIALNHKVFTALAVFALLCERSIFLFTHYTGITMRQVAADYAGMLTTIVDKPLSGPDFLSYYSSLYNFLPLAILLFLAGFLMLVGIVGLMRDLLIDHGYKAQHVFTLGRQYFWPVIKFKLPLYAGVSLLVIMSAGPAFMFFQRGKLFVAIVFGAAIIIPTLISGNMMLSLGQNMIIAGDVRDVSPVYRAVISLLRPYMAEVIMFYVVMLVITGLGFAMPFLIGSMKLPFFAQTLLDILVLSFMTVFLKAASFCLYFRLASIGEAYKGTGF